MKKLRMNLQEHSYDIIIGHDLLAKANQYFDLKRNCLIVTDDGVPARYANTILAQCQHGEIVTILAGEASKSLDSYAMLLKVLLEKGFSRKDCVIAVGGGVVGDLAGFVASSYMRGIDFYNVPTTTLAQVDSSIGGKVAIDFEGVKNVVGAFYQPKGVLIDLTTLQTQTEQQFANGLAEALKTGLIYDRQLFELFEKKQAKQQIEEVIYRSLLCKKDVVEKDEKEQSLRKILNFGHTLGHAIEASSEPALLHGQAVGLGMIPMLAKDLRPKVQEVLRYYGLPTQAHFDLNKAMALLEHDKKKVAQQVSVVIVEEIGQAKLQDVAMDDLKELLKGYQQT